MKHIPNILSGIRILLVGVFVALFFKAQYYAALIVFAVAFFTDLLDGYLARKFNWISSLGKLLDPAADKLLVLAVLVCVFVYHRNEPFYLVIFVLMAVKELLMLIGMLMLLKTKVVCFSDWSGKLATGFFSVGIGLTLMDICIPADITPWNISVLSIAVALSYFAMLHYTKIQMFGPKSARDAKNETVDEKLAESIDKYM
ncbi:MAG: CDP-alcohol phosphatidyltransferase family protein [Clostridiales bacterium]|nr:CDP-alcohol phosphatidyltransferase family protein [Clostridiales bacterium]